jgi:hypothetical protein
MTTHHPDGPTDAASPRTRELFVVSVRDTINPVLTGHAGGRYTSPPQPRDQALALVALLLGRPAGDAAKTERSWTVALAGGQRTITLTPAA